jgi:hypothetical protein
MEREPTVDEVKSFLEKLRASTQKEECWSCDCLQGFLCQLELDAGEEVAELPASLRVSSSQMHECLRCEPCSPGEIFAHYIRWQKDLNP